MNKVLICCLVLILSCQNTENEKKFIHKYGNSNFDTFKGAAIYIRGFDGKGKPIIFYNSNKDSCEAPFIVETDINGVPIGLDDRLIQKECVPDVANALNQVKEYLKYNVCFLSVDENGTVKVNVDEIAEPPNLIRVMDRSFLTEYQIKHWRNIKGNWYMKE